jgi:hypothetical protein
VKSADHVFVYYRVAPARAATLSARVRAMQARLVEGTATRPRLMHREDGTWMEVYENVADVAVFLRALEQAVTAARLDDALLADGQRHVECFTECA